MLIKPKWNSFPRNKYHIDVIFFYFGRMTLHRILQSAPQRLHPWKRYRNLASLNVLAKIKQTNLKKKQQNSYNGGVILKLPCVNYRRKRKNYNKR